MRPFFYKGRFIFIPLAVAAFLSVTGLVVMNLWNYLLPAILHVGVITFWQAIGIFILCKILFGFGGGHGKGGHRGGPWTRYKLQERFKNMTPEEKEKFKAKMGEHMCGHRGWGRRNFDNWEDYTATAEKTAE